MYIVKYTDIKVERYLGESNMLVKTKTETRKFTTKEETDQEMDYMAECTSTRLYMVLPYKAKNKNIKG